MRKTSNALQIAAVLTLALAVAGCDSDSPTAPVQPSPAPPPTSSVWNITVTTNPQTVTLTADGVPTATVTVVARRAGGNQLPAVGSTALLTTTGGNLSNIEGNSDVSIPVFFQANGSARGTLTLTGVSAGVVQLRAQIENSSGAANVTVLEEDQTPLFIQAVSPTLGPPVGGTQVRISGTGFQAPLRVTFGGVAATVVSSGSTSIDVLTPGVNLGVGDISTVAVAVTINVNVDGETEETDSLGSAFTYTRNEVVVTPRIISVTPSSGPNEGGTDVVIFGEGFGNEMQVFFGTTALIEATVTSLTSTRIVAITPSATGPNSTNLNSIVNLRVRDVNSGAEASLAGAFQYGGPNTQVMFISAAGPGQGVYLGGTIVTIFGQGFEEPVAVSFGGVGQQVVSVTGTEIVAQSVPVEINNCNRPTGAFGVTNIETGENTGAGISFTYLPIEPFFGSPIPSSAVIDIATRAILDPPDGQFVINGAGFDPPVLVTFGDTGTGAAVLPPLDGGFDPDFGIGTVLTGSIPTFLGNFSEESCTDPVSGAEGNRFLPVQVNVTVENLVTECSATINNAFIYIPSDQTCRVDTTSSGLTADFSFAINFLTVSFTDTSTGGDPTSWSWDFDDPASGANNTSALPNPTHVFTAPGTYMVMLTVSDGESSSDVTMDVTVP